MTVRMRLPLYARSEAFARLLVVSLVLCVAACTTSGQVVDHAFGFDLRYDDQDAVVLDYRYGNTKLPVGPTKEQLEAGQTFYFQSVQGPMLRGDFLYVKWRVRSTGREYEDTVDL